MYRNRTLKQHRSHQAPFFLPKTERLIMGKHYKYEPITLDEFKKLIITIDTPMEIEKAPWVWETNKRNLDRYKILPTFNIL